MKPPKLPGVEKFKFWDKSLLEDDDEIDSSSPHNTRSNAPGSYSVPHSVFIRGHVIRNTCPTLPQKSVFCDIMDSSNHEVYHSLPTYCRDTRRRKVILPISSRLAAKVLSSTDLPLGLFDIRDYHKSTRLRECTDVVTGRTNLPIRRINCSNSSLHSTDDHELASNLSNVSNVSNFSLSSTSTSSCPIISEKTIVS